MSDERLDAALDLMRRMSPAKTAENLTRLAALVPEMTDSLLQTIDQPLKSTQCPSTGNQFLLSDFNRDGDSFRSPWSNEYVPAIEDGISPSEALRLVEREMNETWKAYARAYHDQGAVSSVYCWDLEDGTFAETGGFAAAFLIKKQLEKGCWDAIHVVQVNPAQGSQDRATYTLTSTVMVALEARDMDLGGSLTRQRSVEMALRHGKRSHIANIGGMIQDEELRLRTQIEDVYFGKTAEIAGLLHSRTSLQERDARKNLAMGLSAALNNRKA
eukprot:ANDGO_06355.mRNA.1 F-actin-capping protein subunit beta